jgi:hypothetical protein
VVFDWHSVLAESTAGEYHVGAVFAEGWGFRGVQAGGLGFEPRLWWNQPKSTRIALFGCPGGAYCACMPPLERAFRRAGLADASEQAGWRHAQGASEPQ